MESASAINWHTVYFLLFSLGACVFALGVVFSSNIVRMAFYLILSLGATSGLFFLANADFVGAMQLMIYVGGTLVLLIFGVMLTAQGPFVSMKTRGGDWILAALVGGSLLAVLVNTAQSVDAWKPQSTAMQEAAEAAQGGYTQTATRLGLGLLGHRVDRLGYRESDPRVSGRSGYLLPFEVVSIHLLVVLIGAAYLARAKRRATAVV